MLGESDRLAVQHDGYAIVEAVVGPEQTRRLIAAIDEIPSGESVRKKSNVYGIRNLLRNSDAVRRLAGAPEVRALVTPILGDAAFAVRGTFFDKVPDANWALRWHQDSVIAVRERRDTPGFHAWATKAGVTQVRPPVEVLQGMLAVRVHLDDSRSDNGPLRVLTGSHRERWLRDEIGDCKTRYPERTCLVSRGGALLMRPLLLHASSACENPGHRRVIHLEFAATGLPGGLEWLDRVGSDAEPAA